MDTREFTEQATRSATEIVRYCHTNDIIEYVDEFILLMALDVSSELCSTGNRASIRADSNREVFDLLDKDPQKKEMIQDLPASRRDLQFHLQKNQGSLFQR